MAEALPPFVGAILPDHLALGGPGAELRRTLEDEGYEGAFYRDDRLRLCLRADVGDLRAIDGNAAIHRLFDRLSALNVAYLERYNAPDAPAEIMRMLRGAGRVGPFRSLILRSPEDWDVHESV